MSTGPTLAYFSTATGGRSDPLKGAPAWRGVYEDLHKDLVLARAGTCEHGVGLEPEIRTMPPWTRCRELSLAIVLLVAALAKRIGPGRAAFAAALVG